MKTGIVQRVPGLMALDLRSSASQRDWSSANRSVRWCWKRDSGYRQRIILFRGELSRDARCVVHLSDWCFYYRYRDRRSEIHKKVPPLASKVVRSVIGAVRYWPSGEGGLATVELCGGPGFLAARPTIEKLNRAVARDSIPRGDFPPPAKQPLDLSKTGPIVLYAGSGLSYEAGLPTLADVHETFGVDDQDRAEFAFGDLDPIPDRLQDSITGTFSGFCDFHVQAAQATPAPSHLALAELLREGQIRRILTDNVDNLFSKLGVGFVRTRSTFPQTHQVEFDPVEQTLLVIGISADRRSIIRQARDHGLSIVVVNPHRPVSPRAQNLSYLQPTDVWYRMSAKHFLQTMLRHEAPTVRPASI